MEDNFTSLAILWCGSEKRSHFMTQQVIAQISSSCKCEVRSLTFMQMIK
ncbi:hypothetical protein [Coleofasciculus sp. FACHB-129]|nr:hypothetical protein [Coleofasciculus sp. FACHB-129]MBD1893870.1 hypothetical protein [Coleofasciculus sp. FACHB-129]